MIYALNELRLAALAPWYAAAKTTLDLFTSPFSPFAYLPESRRLAAGAEVFCRLTQRYEKPAFGIRDTLADGARVGVEERVAIEKPFCRLLRFCKAQARAEHPKVLLVAPLSGHHATLLRDTVRALLPDHDVYVTDWTDARMVPIAHGAFHLDDYVDYIREFIRYLGPDVHVISVCQPTVPVLAAVALMADAGERIAPRTMVMMGGPIDARRSPTAVNDLATRRPMSWFERSVIDKVPAKYPGFMRRVYPGFLQHLGFVAMNPRRHVWAHWDFYNHLLEGDGESAEAHRAFYDEYNAVLDMPAEYYLDTIRTVFKEHRLARGTWKVRGDLVRPQAIERTALLTIEGELDDISGNGQTEAAHGLCSGIPDRKREHLLVPKVGHYGIFSGRRWRETISPCIGQFIRKHR
ncbi:MAG TPA: polyhydroxyalkanoate depolymerase [Burkholderiales bacterium]|nr:polyhydroxyalkanoate depolymerase [Burkholderiales bacterium]